MHAIANTIQNNALSAIAQSAPQAVVTAIAEASANSGVDFAYLLQQAKAESSFDPSAKASTSSATGLYQFIKSTWVDMVDRYGDKYGIETSGKSQQEILALREDPEISAQMAAEFASENERTLNRNWGGDVSATELYFAHFMGAGGASSFLNARDVDGSQPAAVIFPQAAKANQSIFYESSTGRAKSLDEVYAHFDKKFDVKDLDPATVLLAQAPDNAVNAKDAYNSAYAAQENSVVFTSDRSYNALLAVSGFGMSGFGSSGSSSASSSPSIFSSVPGYSNFLQSPLELMMLSQLDGDPSGESDHRKQERYNS